MRKKRMTLQQLANLVNFGWEVEKILGFQIPDPTRFKEFVAKCSHSDLRVGLEALSELIRVIHEISDVDIEIKAEGTHPFLSKIGAFKTPSAAAIGADENLVIPPSPSLN